MKGKYVFIAFSILFQPLYFLMIWMYFSELQTEENLLIRILDISIIILGIVFMVMQGYMLTLVRKLDRKRTLKNVFLVGLVVWFFLEVVLAYWWCFLTGADPLLEHTPFVIIFFGFNFSQYWALKKLGVLGS
ncbi:MAG: hypothetical protein AAFW00_22410 [Bacteroidota bacterium]